MRQIHYYVRSRNNGYHHSLYPNPKVPYPHRCNINALDGDSFEEPNCFVQLPYDCAEGIRATHQSDHVRVWAGDGWRRRSGRGSGGDNRARFADYVMGFIPGRTPLTRFSQCDSDIPGRARVIDGGRQTERSRSIKSVISQLFMVGGMHPRLFPTVMKVCV